MNRILPALLAASAGVLTLGASLPPDAVRPGYWETTSTVSAPIQSTKTGRRCVTAKDVAKFMMGPSNHIYSCVYPQQRAAGGRLSFKGHCTSNKGREADISGQGAYSPTTLHMDAQVETTLGPLPITLTASEDARRIGDVCPPPEATGAGATGR